MNPSTPRTSTLSERQQFGWTLVFNTLIGLGISAFDEGFLVVNLVYSQCIGISIWGLMQILMRLFIRQPEFQGRRLWVAVPLAAIFGYMLGSAIARQLLGFGDLLPVAYPPQKWLGFMVLSLVAGSVISYYFSSRERITVARQATEAALRQAAEARLRLLESQLEPHMLFNTLSNLRVLIGCDPDRATFMLDRMTAYLRATLNGSRTSTHALQNEFDRLRDYLELIAIRMGPRLQFALELPPDLAQQQVPALLLQPLVENSILHGLEPAIAGGSITVRAQAVGTQLQLSVQDNGVGFDTSHTGPGFGLVHVRERLRTLYGDASQLEYTQPEPGGVLARITLPLAP